MFLLMRDVLLRTIPRAHHMACCIALNWQQLTPYPYCKFYKFSAGTLTISAPNHYITILQHQTSGIMQKINIWAGRDVVRLVRFVDDQVDT
jgi:hypothetical protein